MNKFSKKTFAVLTALVLLVSLFSGLALWRTIRRAAP